ncbi:MAG: methionyl-tRNA formyltransferase [Pseudomonadota bacterium]
MKIVFMGSPHFAVAVLDALVADGADIAAVYAQPPRPAGRGHKLRPTPAHARADALGLPVRTPKSLRGAEARAELAAFGADAAIVAAYGLILPQDALDLFPLGCWNAHASLLPRWRGAAPIQRAILAGDAETGVCAMRMTAGLDEGPVALRKTTPITPEDDAQTLHDRLAALAGAAMVDTLRGLAAGTLTTTPQAEDGMVYAAKIDKAEARIDWAQPADAIVRQTRAFHPTPGAWFDLDGERWRLGPARVAAAASDWPPGTVLDDVLTVACGAGAIRPLQLQRPGKAMAAADAVLRGRPIPAGKLLS